MVLTYISLPKIYYREEKGPRTALQSKVVGGSLSNPFICSCLIVVTTYVLLVFYHAAPIQLILSCVPFNLPYFFILVTHEGKERKEPEVKKESATCLCKRKLKKLSVFSPNLSIRIFLLNPSSKNLFPSFLLSKHKEFSIFLNFSFFFPQFISIQSHRYSQVLTFSILSFNISLLL